MSSRRRAARVGSRNRFDVSLLSANGCPATPAARIASRILSRREIWSWFRAETMGRSDDPPAPGITALRRGPVQKIACHRVAPRGHVALAERDLEEMRLLFRRAKHLCAADQISPPDAPEPFIESRGIERLDARPVPIEAFGPDIERERVVPAQVLDVDHFQSAGLHHDDDIGKARNPSTRKDVLPDEELGIAPADMADEMQHPEAARLERIGVRLDDFLELIATRVLE